MPNKKITALTQVTTADVDRVTALMPYVDLTEVLPANQTKKISIEQLTGEFVVEGTLTSAEILDLNSTPILAIADPGVGYYVRIIRLDTFMPYNSIPYATSTNLCLWYDTATRPAFADAYILESTVSRGCMGVLQTTPTSAQTLIIENKAVYFKPFTASNPTAGDSDVKFKLRYSIETIIP